METLGRGYVAAAAQLKLNVKGRLLKSIAGLSRSCRALTKKDGF